MSKSYAIKPRKPVTDDYLLPPDALDVLNEVKWKYSTSNAGAVRVVAHQFYTRWRLGAVTAAVVQLNRGHRAGTVVPLTLPALVVDMLHEPARAFVDAPYNLIVNDNDMLVVALRTYREP